MHVKKRLCGIYKITSPNNKVYIGQSINIEQRWKNYKKYRCSDQKKLFFSLKKYGSENFTYEILEECTSKEQMNEREWYWCEFYKSCVDGLNLMKGGTARKETPQSVRDKLSKRTLSQEQISKMIEGRNKVGVWNKGKNGWMPKELIEQMKKKLIGRPSKYKGIKRSQEIIEKQRAASIGKKWTDERKINTKIVKEKNGTDKLTESHKSKISKSNKDKKKSENHVRALIQAWDERKDRIKELEATDERKAIRREAGYKAAQTKRDLGTSTEIALRTWETKRRNAPKIWTEVKIQFLVESYRKLTKTELVKQLGINPSQILSKMRELEISLKWSKVEQQTLIDNIGKISNADIAALLGRTERGVDGMASRLRKTGKITFRYRNHKK